MEGAGYAAVGNVTGYAGDAVKQYINQTAPVPEAPVTLASAISHIDTLNKRLAEVTNRAHQIAVTVGGPFPAGGEIAGNGKEPQSAVHLLNERIQAAHRQIDHLGNCIGALGRALGT